MFYEYYHVDVLVNEFQVYISYTIEIIRVYITGNTGPFVADLIIIKSSLHPEYQ